LIHFYKRLNIYTTNILHPLADLVDISNKDVDREAR